MSSPSTINKDDLFIELFGDSKWYPSRSDNEITIYQVAHSLSSLGRFTGHANRINGNVYTVAEHSVKVSYLVPTVTALMHDAHEAIVNDLSKPVKVFIGGSYNTLEDDTEAQFARIFGLDRPMSPEIKEADIHMVLIEAFDLLVSQGKDWGYYEKERDEAMKLYIEQPELRAECWSPEKAYEKFMVRYMELTEKEDYLV